MESFGRLVEKKGLDRLIAAFTLLPENLNWHWTHIGGGELLTKLKGQGDRLALQDRITWKGALPQTEVIETYR